MLSSVLLLVPFAAHAYPIDVAISVTAGDVHFERPTAIEWAEIADPKIATVERLETGELLFTGKSVGHTLALLYAEGKAAVWWIEVVPKGAVWQRPAAAPEPLARARKACPTLTLGEAGSEGALTTSIPSEACRSALLSLFQTPAFTARELSLDFSLEALQAQLAGLQAAIAKVASGVDAHYLGAGLVLKGEVTPEQHRKILWTVFRHSVGRMALDDELQVDTADGGTGDTP